MNVKVRTVYQITTKMDETVAFYSDVFGLPLKFRDGNKWSQFDAGGTGFALSSPEEAAPGAHGTVVVLEVDDLDQAQRALQAKGVSITAIRDMGTHGRVLSCHDPDGNVLQLFEKHRPTAAS
jgi:predicted enzyme related to lactoylglutathione lyase